MVLEDVIWATYLGLEDETKVFMSFVPWDTAHAGVWSPRLAGILINVGSAIDSTFRSFLDSPYLNEAPGIDSIRSRKKYQLGLGDYRKAFGSIYPLAATDMYLQPAEEKIYPWERWKAEAAGDSSIPEWWDAYNKVKHDRFASRKEATLRTTLMALGGFLQVCTFILEMRQYLYSIGAIKFLGEKSPQGFARILQLPDPRKDEWGFSSPIFVQTDLFSAYLRTKVYDEEPIL